MPYYIVKGKDSRGKVRRSLPAYLISSSHRTHKTVPDEEKGLAFLAPDEVYFCLTKILGNPIKIIAVRFSLTSERGPWERGCLQAIKPITHFAPASEKIRRERPGTRMGLFGWGKD